jgi:Histidine kinase
MWAAFALICLPYIALTAWPNFADGSWRHLFVFSTVFLTPIIFIGGFIWLSPIAWQWNGSLGHARWSWSQGIRAVIVSEAFLSLTVFLDAYFKHKAGIPPALWPTLLFNLAFQGPAFVVIGNALASREAVETEKELNRLKAEEAQTRLLQSQLHPHILFNALNGLAELLVKDPPKAECFVQSLSLVLRTVMRASQIKSQELEAERLLVENYLSMESLRFGARLQIHWDWDPTLDNLVLPPLLLQPLVENALKHGLTSERFGGALWLIGRLDEGALRLEVRNTGAPLNLGTAPLSGIGLRNLRERLELAFPAQADFSLFSEERWTVARIRIKNVKGVDSCQH